MSLKDIIQELNKGLKGKEAEPDEIQIGRFGRIFEQEFLGFTLPDEYNLFFHSEQYLSFEDSLNKVMITQPVGFNPSDPTEGCNHDFFNAVRFFLPVGKDELRYYIAVGTEMDFWHGIDSVFVWRDLVVTIDITADPEKKEHKSDFLIRPSDVESYEVYTSIARSIALLLLNKHNMKFFQTIAPHEVQ
jgi:hypothetical protein